MDGRPRSTIPWQHTCLVAAAPWLIKKTAQIAAESATFEQPSVPALLPGKAFELLRLAITI